MLDPVPARAAPWGRGRRAPPDRTGSLSGEEPRPVRCVTGAAVLRVRPCVVLSPYVAYTFLPAPPPPTGPALMPSAILSIDGLRGGVLVDVDAHPDDDDLRRVGGGGEGERLDVAVVALLRDRLPADVVALLPRHCDRLGGQHLVRGDLAVGLAAVGPAWRSSRCPPSRPPRASWRRPSTARPTGRTRSRACTARRCCRGRGSGRSAPRRRTACSRPSSRRDRYLDAVHQVAREARVLLGHLRSVAFVRRPR